jgi:hypothetical protein
MLHPSEKPNYDGPLFDLMRLSSTPKALRRDKPVPPINDQVLNRILDAVGERFIPPNLNRTRLWTALVEGVETKEKIDCFRPGSRKRAMIKSIKNIRKAANSLAAALNDNDDANKLFVSLMPSSLEDIKRLCVVAENFERTWSASDKATREQYKRIPSANDWLAGVELPLIFEECFGRKPRRARTNGKPSGPTVRFVAAALSEMDSPLADETIVRAMTRFSELRERRRAVRNKNIGQK